MRVAIGGPSLRDHEESTVRVEDRHVNVTLESRSMHVMIEDKISAGAKQHDSGCATT